MTRPLISPIRPNQIPSAARVMANDSLPRPRRRLGVATHEAENTRDAATRHFVRADDERPGSVVLRVIAAGGVIADSHAPESNVNLAFGGSSLTGRDNASTVRFNS